MFDLQRPARGLRDVPSGDRVTTYAYRVLITAMHRHTGALTPHEVSVDAYTPADAIAQAAVEVDGLHAYTAQGYLLAVLSVAPDTTLAAERFAQLLKNLARLQLLRLPSMGSTA